MWNPSDYCPLGFAYWNVGKALFGDTWTGYETAYRPHSDHRDGQEKVRALEQRCERLNEQIRRKNSFNAIDLSEVEYRAFQNELNGLETLYHETRQEWDTLKEANRGSETSIAAYQRRIAAECRLVDAFRKDELRLIFDRATIVEWDVWSKEPSFKVSFDHSLIYAPHSYASKRRAGAYLAKNSFENWLASTLEPEEKLSKTEGGEEFQAMRNWFKHWLLQHPERQTKEETQRAFDAEFETKAKGTFLKLWKMCAPKNWQEQGRPKSS
jgi:hypothetical protein